MVCNNCGTCCKWVFVDDDPVKMPRDIRRLNRFRCIREFKGCIAIPSRCKHLKEDNTCAIYDKRPLFCKVFDCERVSEKFSNVKELKKLKEGEL